MIVRDLWAYQLAFVQLPPPPQQITSNEIGRGDNPTNLEDDSLSGEEKSDRDGSEGSKSDNGSDLDADREGDIEAELEQEVMAQLSADSSDDDTPLRPFPQSEAEGDMRWKRRRRLLVSDTVVTLIAALWVLRVSFMIVDIEK